MASEIELTLEGRPRDLGGFTVARVLPAISKRMVGPFTFLDHMGPADVDEMTVRPHPHINLATVTYLFRGEILHRDSLGNKQPITPGAINWMSAGRGIAHSERIAKDGDKHSLHGLQLWVALPKAVEDTAPFFEHHPAATLPELQEASSVVRVLCGEAYGAKSPVSSVSPMFYAEIVMQPGARIAVPDAYSERAAYIIEGAAYVGGQRIDARNMAVFAKGAAVTLEADGPTRLVVLGGEPLDGPRYMWWNFVSSSPEKIHEAAAKWRAGTWDKVFDDKIEYTPAPEGPPQFAGERHESHG